MRLVGSQSTLWGLMEVELRWCPPLLHLHREVSSILSQAGEITRHQKPTPRQRSWSWDEAVSECWLGAVLSPHRSPTQLHMLGHRENGGRVNRDHEWLETGGWQEPVPSNSARDLSVLCFARETKKGFVVAPAPLLLPWVQLLHLWKQQPPLPGLQSICP